MLSDSNKFKDLPSKRRRGVAEASRKKIWSDSQKVEAVTTYLALGNLALTAASLKIPEGTLRMWKATVWWKELQDELSLQEDLQLSERLKRIIDGALTAVDDRVRNGDSIWDSKSGSLVKKPIAAKDAHRIAMDMTQKRIDIKKASIASVPTEMIEDRLLKLAERMAQIATGVKPVVQVTDVVVGEFEEYDDEPPSGEEEEDAIPNQREA